MQQLQDKEGAKIFLCIFRGNLAFARMAADFDELGFVENPRILR